MFKTIAIHQQWLTRGGSLVRIILDRGAGSHGGWRWGLSNGEFAHESNGRVSFTSGEDHFSDLVKLMAPDEPPSDEAIEGMDSTWGHL